jgi:hypothetical protein
MGLWAWCVDRAGRLGETGITIGIMGSGWGIFGSLVNVAPRYESLLLYWYDMWIPTLLVGVTVAGLATIRPKKLWSLGSLQLSMGMPGWGYYLTDSGAFFEARSVHIVFGVLFSMCWVALGLGLRAAGVQRVAEPLARD